MSFVKKIAILLLCFTVLGCFSACGILVRAIQSQTAGKSSSGEKNISNEIYGEWVTKKGTLFIMNEDGTCGWYKSKDDRKDNYYSGKKITVLQGDEALKELGVNKEEQKSNEFYSDSSTIFSVRLYFDYLISGGVDKSKQLNKDGYKWMMLKITDTVNKTAIAYDFEDDQTYELTKLK
jgi:uncharacterized protein (DUF2147 family)